METVVPKSFQNNEQLVAASDPVLKQNFNLRCFLR